MLDELNKQKHHPISTECLTNIPDAQGDWVLTEWRVPDSGAVEIDMAVVEIKSMQRDLTLDLEVQHTGALYHKIRVGDLFRAGDVIGSVVAMRQETRLPQPPGFVVPPDPAEPVDFATHPVPTPSEPTQSSKTIYIEQLFSTERQEGLATLNTKSVPNREKHVLTEEDSATAGRHAAWSQIESEGNVSAQPHSERREGSKPLENSKEDSRISLDQSQLQLISLTLLITGAFLGIVLSDDDVSRYMSAALMLVLVHPYCKRYFDGGE